jgi:hypothetical protein
MSVVRADPTTFNYIPSPAAGSDACSIAQGQVPDENEDSEVIDVCSRTMSRQRRMVGDAAVVEVIKSWVEAVYGKLGW